MIETRVLVGLLAVFFGGILLLYTSLYQKGRKSKLAVVFMTIGTAATILSESITMAIGGGMVPNVGIVLIQVVGFGLGLYFLVVFEFERKRRTRHRHRNNG